MLLQNALGFLLQNVTVLTVTAKCDVYYNLRQYKLLEIMRTEFNFILRHMVLLGGWVNFCVA